MKPELKKLLILNAPYLLFVYLFDKIGQAVRLSPGTDLSGKVLSLADGFSAAFTNPLPSLAPMDLLIGIVGAVLIRLMVYFKGKNAKKYRKGMLIVQDQTWNRVTINRAEKKSTRYYMDEFHLLLKEEQTAAYSVEIWKRFRKWGGIPTAITQNVKDLLASREVENIFENSDFVLMLNQAQGDRTILAKQLNISPQQMKYVTHTEAGEGLIFYGNVVLPFVDRFPKDTELYRVMTTKPEEVSESGK